MLLQLELGHLSLGLLGSLLGFSFQILNLSPHIVYLLFFLCIFETVFFHEAPHCSLLDLFSFSIELSGYFQFPSFLPLRKLPLPTTQGELCPAGLLEFLLLFLNRLTQGLELHRHFGLRFFSSPLFPFLPFLEEFHLETFLQLRLEGFGKLLMQGGVNRNQLAAVRALDRTLLQFITIHVV